MSLSGAKPGRPSATDSARPRQSAEELLAKQKFAIRAIENVEKTVSVGMQKKLSILAAIFCVHQDVGLGCIPIVNIVRSELVIPLQLSGTGIERQNAIRKQVVAASLAIVGIRPWDSPSPR